MDYLDFLGMQVNVFTHRAIPLLISVQRRLETALVKLCISDSLNAMSLAVIFCYPNSFIG